MSLAPSNYANIPGRALRLVLNIIGEAPGCLCSYDVQVSLVALSNMANTRQIVVYTMRGDFVRMRRAGLTDYAEKVDAVVQAVLRFRRALGENI